MLRLGPRRRRLLAETLRELANLVVGALVLGQFVGQQAPSPWLMSTGIAVWFVLVGASLWLRDEKAHD